MKLIKKFISLLSQQKNPVRDNVLYKIIDELDTDTYLLQCVNSKTTIKASIIEIIYDTDILHGLHPLQSCFIGIEYAFNLKTIHEFSKYHPKQINDSGDFQSSFLYKLKLKYRNRKGDICYNNLETNEELIAEPKVIAFTDYIIQEFHPGEAFYIGLCAGIKMRSMNNVVYFKNDINTIKTTNITS